MSVTVAAVAGQLQNAMTLPEGQGRKVAEASEGQNKYLMAYLQYSISYMFLICPKKNK